jgi:hypothetical protein
LVLLVGFRTAAANKYQHGGVGKQPGKNHRQSCHRGTTNPTLLKKTTRRLATTSYTTATSLATTQTSRHWPRHHDAANTIQDRNKHGSTAAWPHHGRGTD